jgi:hypothetical protein
VPELQKSRNRFCDFDCVSLRVVSDYDDDDYDDDNNKSLYLRRDSTVGIATRYGLDGPGIESQWG